jgi:hypothetical protein
MEAVEENLRILELSARLLKWNENDPPAYKDILAARLRAKFYGAQVVMYRPFVREVLQYSWSVRQQERVQPKSEILKEIPKDEIPGSAFQSRPSVTASKKDMSEDDIAKRNFDKNEWHYIELGIKALINSTKAFWGLGDERLIVTNVFGTAHA